MIITKAQIADNAALSKQFIDVMFTNTACKVSALIKKAKMYQDDLLVVGIMTVRVFSKATNSFKCTASIKFKQKRYLGPLSV